MYAQTDAFAAAALHLRHLRRFAPFLLLLALAPLPVCFAQSSATDLRPIIAARFPAVRWIEAPRLRRWLAEERPVVLLDARRPDEFAVSHLAGAARIDPDAPDLDALSGVDRAATVVVYCSVGWRSASVARVLADAGFGDVYNLEGGLFDWANAGLPFEGERVHPYDEVWGRFLRPRLRAPL
jgi:rhodanese-related sulfurtransferase